MLFYITASAILVFALARPRVGSEKIIFRAKGIDIILAIDLSGSMRAIDIPRNIKTEKQLKDELKSGKIKNRLEVAKEEGDYKKWAAAKKAEADAAAAAASSDKTWSKAELMAKGAAVYGTSCAACHQANGEGTGPFPPLKGSALATGPAAGHIDIVVNGSKTNPLMAAYGAQLNDLDLAAVITYERNSWGNNAGIVQPKDVKAARESGARFWRIKL